MLPDCRNFKICKNKAWIYIYGEFYCGDCVKRFEDKIKQRTEELLIQENAD